MSGLMDGWMDMCVDGYITEQTKRTYKWMDGGLLDGWMDEWIA